jgi:hypothetical protein
MLKSDIIRAEPLRQYGIVWMICQSTRLPHPPPTWIPVFVLTAIE